MIRSILSVVVGYLVSFVFVAIFFAFAMFCLGNPGDPKTFQPPLWLLVTELIWAPIASLAGGYVCAWIARVRPLRHAAVLAGLMLVLGAVSAATEAGIKPVWSLVLLPVLGAAGALAGARLRLAYGSSQVNGGKVVV